MNDTPSTASGDARPPGDLLDAGEIAGLVNGSHELAMAGRLGDAVRDLRYAARQAQRHFTADPAGHRELLVVALLNLEGRLIEAGRPLESTPVLRDLVAAMSGHRPEEKADGTEARQRPGKIQALRRLARRLSAGGDQGGAIAAAVSARDESAEMRGDPHPHAEPASHEQTCHSELLLADLLEATGRVDESFAAGERALACQAALAMSGAGHDGETLGDAAADMGLRLLRHDRAEDAVEHLRRATEIYREHLAADPGHPSHRANLAICADRLGVALSTAARHEAAVPYFREAADALRAGGLNDPGERSELAKALRDLAVCLIQLNRDEEAVAALEESARHYRPLAEADPRHAADLDEVLDRVWRGLRILGRDEESARYRAEWSARTGAT